MSDIITEGGRQEGARLRKLARRANVQVDTIEGTEVLRFGKGSQRSDRAASAKSSERIRNERRWTTVREARRRRFEHRLRLKGLL